MKLINVSDLRAADIVKLWEMVDLPDSTLMPSKIACSFEGNGVRTRTSFLQAIGELGASFIELPNLLKTAEAPQDLTGYLDTFYDGYVVRDSDHEKLRSFAQASSKPVINAMSGMSHPCEVLTDAYFIDRHIMSIKDATVCLWGRPTNVFGAWHELASVLPMKLVHVCDAEFHALSTANVRYTDELDFRANVLITDSTQDSIWQPLTQSDLQRMGNPSLIVTPPFIVGREISFHPTAYPGFVGYEQKNFLLPVQKAILRMCLQDT
jgi:ornithine carbamoyltransferase